MNAQPINPGEIRVRRLEPREWGVAYPIMVQLRPHLDPASFLDRVRRQSQAGYELVGAFRAEVLVGVLGIRPVHTLARGAYLHVDDLVVDASVRGSGTGRALIEYAESDARARGMGALFLDARKEAIPFYERLGYGFHPSPSMTRKIG